MRRVGFLMFALLACLVSAQWLQGQTIIFDAPGAGSFNDNQGTFAVAMTPARAIAGWYVDANFVNHGFVRAPDGAITPFDAPGAGTVPLCPPGGCEGTQAFAINSRDVIAGTYIDSSGVSHGFLRDPDGAFTTFDVPGAGTGSGQGTVAANINPSATSSGFYMDAGNVVHGFVRAKDGSITTFDAPGAGTSPFQGTFTSAGIGLNAAGVIAGDYFDANFVIHGFVRAKDGTITTFDAPGAATLPFEGTVTDGINPAGEVVGSFLDPSSVSHGYVRAKNGAITAFNVSGAGTGIGQGTFAASINPVGAITGYYVDANAVNHGFVRAKDGLITTFDVPGAGTTPFEGTQPFINNPAGAIAGTFFNSSDSCGTGCESLVAHGFLRTP